MLDNFLDARKDAMVLKKDTNVQVDLQMNPHNAITSKEGIWVTIKVFVS